jgi:hypothetical protein
MKRTILSAALLAAVCMNALAQSGTNSPYSQFGLGILSDQTSGFNRGMNGLGFGFHEHNQVNYINPASYSSIDSLSFIFDVGISGQITNFKEGTQKLNANNADLEYVVAGFRAFRHVGMSFGIIPFTNIGYNYATTSFVDKSLTTTATNTYNGSGGIHEVYLGLGWEPFKGFSFGANIGYLWGDYTRSLVNKYSDNTTNTLSKYYTGDVRSYKLDAGIQYTAHVAKKDWVTLAGTYSLGHKINTNPQCQVISTNSETSVSDTTTYIVNNGLEIPDMFGAGFMWNHNNQWKIGFDYSLQKWADLQMPVYSVVNEKPQYELSSDVFMNRSKFTLGGEYCPLENGRNFFKRIHYRAGVSYATPYVKVNGQDGPKEISASFGFGIPIMNGYNTRSLLNISGQWVHSDATGLIKENIFRINIGLTFNERWFAKWKVE